MSEDPKSPASEWNWHPSLPIPTSPVFSWPPKPIAGLKWLASYWLWISGTTMEILVAILIWNFFMPDMETMATLSLGWVSQIYVRNLILICLVAGSLHLYFYTLKKQEAALKFDPRSMAKNNGKFTFRNQVHDNMFWTLASGVTIWTTYEVLWFWAAANGYTPLVTFSEAPVWFLAWFAIIPIWASLHFYWIHRLIHWPPLYRLAHSLHHRNVNVGPWTGISMHPVEHLLYFSSVVIHFVVLSHPLHFLFHLFVQALNPPLSHSGFDGLKIGGVKKVELGDFFHQMHHRYFECNYGTVEMPWDKWFGSFHDGTKEAHEGLKEHRQKIMSQYKKYRLGNFITRLFTSKEGLKIV